MDNKFANIGTGLLLLGLTLTSVKAESAPVVVGHLAGNGDSVAQQSLVTTDNQSATPATQAENTSNLAEQQYQSATNAAFDDEATQYQVPGDDKKSQLSLLDQIQQMQVEMRQMQGQLEVQAHQIKLLEQGQAQVGQVKPSTGENQSMENADNTNNQMVPASKASSAQAKAALNEQQVYQQAYQLLTSKQYAQAQTAMQDYLKQYPKGKYAANAHYWLGELALIDGSSNSALSQFNTVIKQFQQSDKVPDSILKIGFIYYETHQFNKAADKLNEIVNKFPDSSSAKLAKQRLQMMKTSGNI